MAKELRKICCGLARARDVTWFTELSQYCWKKDFSCLHAESCVTNFTNTIRKAPLE